MKNIPIYMFDAESGLYFVNICYITENMGPLDIFLTIFLNQIDKIKDFKFYKATKWFDKHAHWIVWWENDAVECISWNL